MKYKYIPSIFTIETSLKCQLKCASCPKGCGLINRPEDLMSFDTFKIIADKIKPWAKYVNLHNWGEPLLNHDIVKMIQYLESPICHTNIHTNGQYMTDELAEKLILSGADIFVSIDAMSKETYEIYRKNGNMDKVIKTIEMLAKYKNKYGTKPRQMVFLQMVVFKHNQEDIEKFELYCKSIEVEYSLKSPYIRKGYGVESSSIKEFVRPDFSLDSINKCIDMDKVMTILIDGTLCICCYDYNGDNSYGNLLEHGTEVLDVYNGEKANYFRDKIKSPAPLELCMSGCMSFWNGK